MVTHAQNAVRRFRFTEHNRRTCIFRSADHRRRLRYKARSVAAEADCTQVVALLHRITLAVETERRDTSVLYHRLIAGGVVVETVFGIERAEVNPTLLTLGREFVLELDMVEVLVVEVKAVYLYREIVACGVARREGIHYPVLSWHGNVHRTGLGQEVYAQRHVCTGTGTILDIQDEVEIVVIHGTSLHLNGLRDRLTGQNPVPQALDERRTVDIYFGTIGVGGTVERELEARTLGSITGVELSAVRQFDAERSTCIRIDIRLLVGIRRQFGLVYPERTAVERRTRVVELRVLFFFVRTVSRARYGVEDIAAVEHVVIVFEVCRFAYLLRVCFPRRIQFGAIDADGEITHRIRRNREAVRMALTAALGLTDIITHIRNRCIVHVELPTVRFGTYLLLRFLRPVAVAVIIIEIIQRLCHRFADGTLGQRAEIP